MTLFKIVFYIFASVLILLLLIKIYLSDYEDEQKDFDKIDQKTVTSLVNLMMSNKGFKDKFKL